MHHIKDSHEFHIMDINGHAVSFPLPIILWTENGLVTFLSSEFDHDDSGKVIVKKKKQAFVKYHEKIYYAEQTGYLGKYVIYDDNGVVLNKKPLDLSITKMVFSMFMSIPDSSAIKIRGLLVSLVETTTSLILSLSSFFKTLIKSLIFIFLFIFFSFFSFF